MLCLFILTLLEVLHRLKIFIKSKTARSGDTALINLVGLIIDGTFNALTIQSINLVTGEWYNNLSLVEFVCMD